jgi:hypothetical protein
LNTRGTARISIPPPAEHSPIVKDDRIGVNNSVFAASILMNTRLLPTVHAN